jgi:hypothetical protein
LHDTCKPALQSCAVSAQLYSPTGHMDGVPLFASCIFGVSAYARGGFDSSRSFLARRLLRHINLEIIRGTTHSSGHGKKNYGCLDTLPRALGQVSNEHCQGDLRKRLAAQVTHDTPHQPNWVYRMGTTGHASYLEQPLTFIVREIMTVIKIILLRKEYVVHHLYPILLSPDTAFELITFPTQLYHQY